MAKLKQSAIVVKKSTPAKVVVKSTKVVVKPKVTAKVTKVAVKPKVSPKSIKAVSKSPDPKKMASSASYTPQQRMSNYAKGKTQVDIFDEIMDVPQKSFVAKAGFGYQKPAEAIGIKNKYAKAAINAVADPVNALFFLRGSKLAGLASEASKPKLIQGVNLTHPRAAARIVDKAKKIKGAAASLDAQSIYSDIKSGVNNKKKK